jgi:hypothetical protein
VALRELVEALLPVRRVERRATVARVLLHPVDDAPVEIGAVRRAAVEHEEVRGIRVEHEPRRDASLAERSMPLLGLADGAAEVGRALVDQRRRAHRFDLRQR